MYLGTLPSAYLITQAHPPTFAWSFSRAFYNYLFLRRNHRTMPIKTKPIGNTNKKKIAMLYNAQFGISKFVSGALTRVIESNSSSAPSLIN